MIIKQGVELRKVQYTHKAWLKFAVILFINTEHIIDSVPYCVYSGILSLTKSSGKLRLL